jgi:hypothetical protein
MNTNTTPETTERDSFCYPFGMSALTRVLFVPCHGRYALK